MPLQVDTPKSPADTPVPLENHTPLLTSKTLYHQAINIAINLPSPTCTSQPQEKKALETQLFSATQPSGSDIKTQAHLVQEKSVTLDASLIMESAAEKREKKKKSKKKKGPLMAGSTLPLPDQPIRIGTEAEAEAETEADTEEKHQGKNSSEKKRKKRVKKKTAAKEEGALHGSEPCMEKESKQKDNKKETFTKRKTGFTNDKGEGSLEIQCNGKNTKTIKDNDKKVLGTKENKETTVEVAKPKKTSFTKDIKNGSKHINGQQRIFKDHTLLTAKNPYKETCSPQTTRGSPHVLSDTQVTHYSDTFSEGVSDEDAFDLLQQQREETKEDEHYFDYIHFAPSLNSEREKGYPIYKTAGKKKEPRVIMTTTIQVPRKKAAPALIPIPTDTSDVVDHDQLPKVVVPAEKEPQKDTEKVLHSASVILPPPSATTEKETDQHTENMMEILNKKISLIEQEHFRISHSDSTKKSETAHANHPNETYKSQENAVVTGDVPEPESELPIQPPVKTKRYVKEARPRQNTKSRKNYGYLHKDDILQGNRKAFYKRFMDPMEVDQGLQDETIYSGLLRINKHNRQEAYITSDSLEGDVFISSQRYRNRALEGDMVAFQLVKEIRTTKVDEQDNTKEKGKTRTHPCGVVVYILSRSPEQIFSGVLISDLNGNRNVVCKEDGKNDKEKEKSSNESLWFRPLDKRVPIIFIPASYIPLDFKYNQEYHKNILVSAEIIRWRIDSMHPIGKLIKELGPIGSFDSEEKVILTDHNIRDEKFSEEIMSGLPSIPWEIPSVEYKVRRNYSKERIFSIDPATAKDLDDALHIKPYENGMFEVGVHIADVSFFIKMGTPLDKEAYRRGTSTYLVDKVVPMLPPLLCEELCSLNPGVERLAFSVVWIMDAEGKVYNTWFGRSIINSCAKLTYEDAQSVIEGRGLPSTARLFSQSVKDVETDILYLYQLSQHMRARRFNNGALSMNSVRLSFKLDKDGNPDSVFAYESKESNRMIEEFMLCANMSVARKLYECYPDQSVLRRHAPPIERRLEEFIRFADALGYDIDGSSAGALQCSFDMIDDEDISSVLKILATKPMQRAKYFCTGSLHQSKYIHYALNTPLYTHFTSPIRRYADVVVHRQLQAALDKNATSGYQLKEVENIVLQCNKRKNGAKNAQDQNIMIYLALYLYRLEEKQGLIVCPAIVLQVGKEAFELLVPEYGLERRCYLDSLSLKGGLFDEEKNTITLYWNKNTMPHLQVGKLKSTDDIEEITPVEEAVPSSPSESTEALTKEPQPASVENDTSHHSEYVQKLSPFIRLQVLLQADMNTSPPIIRVYPINPFADYPKFFPR